MPKWLEAQQAQEKAIDGTNLWIYALPVARWGGQGVQRIGMSRTRAEVHGFGGRCPCAREASFAEIAHTWLKLVHKLKFQTWQQSSRCHLQHFRQRMNRGGLNSKIRFSWPPSREGLFSAYGFKEGVSAPNPTALEHLLENTRHSSR